MFQGYSIRRNPMSGLAVIVFALMILAIACNSGSESGLQQISTATTTIRVTPVLTDPPTGPGSPEPSISISPERTAYLESADKVMDIVSQTAQLLSGTGLSAVFVEGDRSETKGIAEVVVGSFDLAKASLESNPVPDDMVKFHTAMLEAIRLYSKAAQVLIDLPDSADYDVFEFQEPFQEAGEILHEATALFSSP